MIGKTYKTPSTYISHTHDCRLVYKGKNDKIHH